MGRLVSAGRVICDQIDIYIPANSVVRKQGENFTQLALVMFVDNNLLAWPLADGTNVPDSSISAGVVYFNQIAGAPGFYSVRFFPDRVGFWRLVFQEQALGEEIIRSYDVVPPLGSTPNGLNASFIPQP